MNLQQLRYFLAAAEEGSFTAAARSLYIAQPSLSEQIRQLEAELGVELFARVGRGIVLTAAGRTLRPEAERVLAAVDTARDAVRDVREIRGGTISFGMFGTASAYLVSGLVDDFRKRYPDVRLRLVGQNSSLVADAVRSGRLEAALVVLPVEDDGLELRPVHREELVVVSKNADHVAEPMTMTRLSTIPLILYDAEYGWADPTRRQLAERAQTAGVTLRPVIEVEDMEAALQLAQRGLGATVVARATLRDRRGARSLHVAAFAEPMWEMFAFIGRRDAPVSPGTRAFVEIVEKRLESFGEISLYGSSTSEPAG
ncbi:MAG: LysR family transcriptional regulator [Gaiellales bacterium]